MAGTYYAHALASREADFSQRYLGRGPETEGANQIVYGDAIADWRTDAPVGEIRSTRLGRVMAGDGGLPGIDNSLKRVGHCFPKGLWQTSGKRLAGESLRAAGGHEDRAAILKLGFFKPASNIDDEDVRLKFALRLGREFRQAGKSALQ